MLSKRKQKRTMIGMTVCMIPVAVAIVLTLTHEEACFAASAASVEEITVETAEALERAEFDDLSAMPCIDPEGFRKWYEEYQGETQEEINEQETSEETAEKPDINTDRCEDVQTGIPTELPTEVETTVEVPSERVEETVAVYSVNGELIDPIIQQKLHDALEKHGIGYWFEGALCQMYQESRGQQYAVNPHNGIDCGLFQYRSTYWNGGDIFDVDAQIERYASDMAARFNAGLTADEAISRHNTSDFVTDINWTYVQQVRQHLATMEVIE